MNQNQNVSAIIRRQKVVRSIVGSAKRFIIVIILLIIGTLSSSFLFDQFIAGPANLNLLMTDIVRATFILIFGSVVIFLIRKFRTTLATHVGPHPSTIISFFMVIIAMMVVILGILNAFHVPPNTLLLGGGIVSIIIGLVVSALFGNIISGALMLVTYPFRTGDSVLVDNIPGRVEEITTMFTRIINNSGSETVIPNVAIIQGAVKVTRMQSDYPVSSFPYTLGDRVYTTYIGGEGVVKEITIFHTKVLLDSGKEITIPNNSVLTGTIHIARIVVDKDPLLTFSLKIDWDAEKAIEAMKKASKDLDIFKSELTIHYSSLQEEVVDLRVCCKVEPDKKDEAKSILLKATYLAKYSVNDNNKNT